MNYFQLKQHGTNVKQEVMAGITTFVTMAYISVVNPAILSDAGIPFAQAFTATIIAILIGTGLMAFYANLPIAVAPGMGLNAFFAYTLVAQQQIAPSAALGVVFVSSVFFLILSLSPIRTKLIQAIPASLKHAITTGIGLFIASLGLKLSGLIVADEANLVRLGDLSSPSVLLVLGGLIVSALLFSRNVPGSLLIGMVLTGIAAYFMGLLKIEGVTAMPTLPEGLMVNPLTAFSDVIQYGLFGAVLSFFLVTLFDTTGTLVGVGKQANLLKEDGTIENGHRALFADSLATMGGSLVGTSPSTAYIESAAGVAQGGRTGLTTAVVAGLFGLTLFFSPLIGAISGVAAITAPALIIVGALMLTNVRYIDWTDFSEYFPAFMTILIMPLSGSIERGIAFGFILYPIFKAMNKETVHPLIYLFGALFILEMFFL